MRVANISFFSHCSSVCPGGHWLKSKSLKLSDSFGKSSLTLRSVRTLAVRQSEGVELLNLLSNLLFLFVAILHDELVDIAEIGDSPVASEEVVFGE